MIQNQPKIFNNYNFSKVIVETKAENYEKSRTFWAQVVLGWTPWL